MPHNYNQFPELTNKQIEEFGFTSPHKQIVEDFNATVVKVHDGDTITLRTTFRDFDFPLRVLDIDAKELNEGGETAREWLKSQIEQKEIMVIMNRKNRVGKYGRLLGKVLHNGLDMGEAMLTLGLVQPFGQKNEGEPEPLDKVFSIKQWF
jgi:endonuclease YncB( thermonuclease family)|tara:strand:+ start:2167 stop:2616 length:450 start_codon:yes stop_codon:yes gene_type:complete